MADFLEYRARARRRTPVQVPRWRRRVHDRVHAGTGRRNAKAPPPRLPIRCPPAKIV